MPCWHALCCLSSAAAGCSPYSVQHIVSGTAAAQAMQARAGPEDLRAWDLLKAEQASERCLYVCLWLGLYCVSRCLCLLHTKSGQSSLEAN